MTAFTTKDSAAAGSESHRSESARPFARAMLSLGRTALWRARTCRHAAPLSSRSSWTRTGGGFRTLRCAWPQQHDPRHLYFPRAPSSRPHHHGITTVPGGCGQENVLPGGRGREGALGCPPAASCSPLRQGQSARDPGVAEPQRAGCSGSCTAVLQERAGIWVAHIAAAPRYTKMRAQIHQNARAQTPGTSKEGVPSKKPSAHE